jgi:HK97 family phage major capsid protein
MPTPITPEDIASRIENVGTRVTTNEDRLKAVEDALKAKPTAKAEPIRLHGIIRGLSTGRWDGFEREEAAYKAQRTALNTGTPSGAGYLVPVESGNALIEQATAKSVLSQAGVQTIRPKGSPYTLPRVASGLTCAYVAELTGLTDASNPVFEQVSVTPHQLTALCELTRLQAELGDPSTEQVVRNLMARDMALKMDYTGLLGTGSNTPTGLFNDGAIEATALNAVLTLDHCEDALTRLEMANGIFDESKVAWIMSPRDWGTLRKSKGSTNDHFNFAPDKGAKTPRSLLGYPVYLTSQIPKNFASGVANESTIALGDWSSYAHVLFGDMVLESTNVGGGSWAAHTVSVKSVVWDDWKVLQPDSFQLITDIR